MNICSGQKQEDECTDVSVRNRGRMNVQMFWSETGGG